VLEQPLFEGVQRVAVERRVHHQSDGSIFDLRQNGVARDIGLAHGVDEICPGPLRNRVVSQLPSGRFFERLRRHALRLFWRVFAGIDQDAPMVLVAPVGDLGFSG